MYAVWKQAPFLQILILFVVGIIIAIKGPLLTLTLPLVILVILALLYGVLSFYFKKINRKH
jgi:hypothetical protein